MNSDNVDDNPDLFAGHGIEVFLKQPNDFLKVKETLTRIGVASSIDQTLFQSCHILHKRGRYAIVHFKEMFSLDGRESTMSEEDEGRRNTIAKLLEDWGLLDIEQEDWERVEKNSAPMRGIKIIPFRDKSNWKLVEKYPVGKRRPSR